MALRRGIELMRAVLAIAFALLASPVIAGPEGPSFYGMQPSPSAVSAARSRRTPHPRLSAPHDHSVSLAGVYAPLAAKARQIVSECGSTVISGVRHTKVAGTSHWSLHASGRAVDMRGNPGCIYAHLSGWPGGYSTDYGRVLHVHISLGGREDGLRFAHHHVHRHKRYARR